MFKGIQVIFIKTGQGAIPGTTVAGRSDLPWNDGSNMKWWSSACTFTKISAFLSKWVYSNLKETAQTKHGQV